MYSNFEKNCIELISGMPKKRSRHCFRSALRHLELADRLIEVDPAMAIFRGITAEEEAASGLMFALRELKYPGADRIKPHNHVHKHALFPFVKIVGLFFGQVLKDKMKEYRLHIKDEDGKQRLMLAFPMQIAGKDQWAYPIPPLNIGIKVGKTGMPPSYRSQITEFVAAKGAKNVSSYLKKEVNLRNEILYAAPSGYPEVVTLKPEFLREKGSHVMVLLQAYLMIAPYKELQPYVQNAVEAFAIMIGTLENAQPTPAEA